MTYKQILVPMSGAEGAQRAASAALKLAKACDAHVTGCDAVPDPQPFIDMTGAGLTAGAYSEVLAAMEKATKLRRTRAHDAFFDACAKMKVELEAPRLRPRASAAWVKSEGRAASIVSTLGRVADLVVVDLPGKKSDLTTLDILEQAVFDTGRPVMAVPENGSGAFTGRSAIAWNGSVQAARAVAGALPLLLIGKGVDIITVGEVKGADADALSYYLSCHGIAWRKRELKDRKGGTGKLIHESAQEYGAGLVVMGAYTHGPMREMIFGGVTRHMFESARLPLLLAH